MIHSLFEDFLCSFTEGIVDLVVELFQFNTVLFDQALQVNTVVGVGFRHGVGVFFRTCSGNDCLVCLGQAVVPCLVAAHGQHRARLMHAREVIVLGSFVELHEVVVERTNPLCCIDGAGNEVFVDLATRQGHRRRAELRHDVAALTRNTHLQTLQVVSGFDFLVEPAAHLHAGVPGRKVLQAESGSKFVPEFLAAAILNPGVHLGHGQTERNGRERSPTRVLALPVVVGGNVCLRVSGSDLIEGVECSDTLAGSEVLNVYAAFGQLGNTSGQTLCGNTQTREIAWPGRHDDHVCCALCDSRCSKRRTGGNSTSTKTSFFDKRTTIH